MYAILDIETTGGQYNEEGITEIAIYRFDGMEVVDQFISLVNPEKPIQPYVAKLTGINNAMLRTAPKFYEVAKRIIEITQDCIIVAHNASFDYRILRTEFQRLGYTFESKTICTVELSQKLLPDVPSYSLGKLARTLGIPVADRHRASGDAMATVKLFKLLLDKDLEKSIVSTYIKQEQGKAIASSIQKLLDPLPSQSGIYYCFDNKGTLLYWDRSKNILKSATQTFTKTSAWAKRLQKQCSYIQYEATGSDLIGLLKAVNEAETLKTKFRINTRMPYLPWAIYAPNQAKLPIDLEVLATDFRKKPIAFYRGENQAREALTALTANWITLVEKDKNSDFQLYLDREFRFRGYFLLVDKGRKIDERSGILICDGMAIGYLYFELNYQIQQIEILKKKLIPIAPNKAHLGWIQQHLRKHRNAKLIPLQYD